MFYLLICASHGCVIFFCLESSCALNNICKGVCHKTPKGGVCGCQDGYRLAADGISCEDIDECKGEYNCSQICQNTEGSYECLCNEGFVIHDDKVTCKSIGKSSQLNICASLNIYAINIINDFRPVNEIYHRY